VQIGVVFPTSEIGSDRGAVRAYALAAEELGYRHIVAYDHVVGVDPEVHKDWNGPVDVHTMYHEPLVLFGYLAALTSMELASGVVILPQRQTVLAAKQAAQVDLLTGGKFRMGIGVGFVEVEFEALGQDFQTRGRRIEEQVTLMRRMWTEHSVTFEGEFDRITGAGFAPMPLQRPIPVWMGAQSPRGYQRIGRIADGWFPLMSTGPRLDEAVQTVARAATDAGRDPADIGMEGRINWQNEDQVAADLQKWRDAGATHVGISTMYAGLKTFDDHLAAIAASARAAKAYTD
jgi:probable F420-dependent oxidoreductase